MEINMNKIMLTLAAVAFACAASIADAQTGVYIGAGTAVQGTNVDNAQWGGTATVGYRLNRHLSVEALADFSATTGSFRGNQAIFGVVTAGYPLGPVTPYVLAGVGYGFNGLSVTNNDPGSLWTAGAGVAYNMDRNWQLDARYRRIESFNGDAVANRFTVGVNYRF
jgi:opacity protein-like surface antigen